MQGQRKQKPQKRIGLIRHFKVDCPLPTGWFTCAEFMDWRERYDEAGVFPEPLHLGTGIWDHCMSSDLPRAWQTARAVFQGSEIEARKELREVGTALFQTGGLRLPVFGWRWLYRFAWMLNHPSQSAIKQDFMGKVKDLAAELTADSRQNLLVVSHAGLMIFLRRELLKLGFKGPNFKVPDNSRLYVFTQEVG